jgi:type I restriction enzyme, S subunit
MARNDETAEILLSSIGDFPERWEHSTLGKACALVTDGTHDSPKETAAGFPLVTGKCITGGRVNLAAAYLISQADHKAVIARSKPEFGDILFANIGNSIGELARVETQAEFSIKNVALFKPSAKLESQYLKYYLRSPVVQAYIRGNTFGSAQPFIGLGTLRAFPIPLPPVPEQKAITAVLGTLDDKIELNRQMNATLDAMARALFRSWFVDFDPVRANLDGNPGRLDKSIGALFPSHLEESPLGKVPVGWRVLNFADLLTAYSERVGDDSVPEFSATVTGLSSRDERFKKQLSKSQSKNKRIVKGDLVFGFSREVINFGLMHDPVGAVSPVYEVFKIDSTKMEPDLLERLFRFNMSYYMDILKPGAREGKPIDRNYLLRKHLLVPDMAAQRAFLATVKPWTDKIKANDSESRTLANLRDTLLPKLLSGELHPNQERFPR